MTSAGESNVDPSESGAKWRQYLRAMGPGLITGASDDDPSGIATHAQAGSKYGLSFLRAVLLSIPTECIHLIIPRSWVRSPPALLRPALLAKCRPFGSLRHCAASSSDVSP